MGERDKGGRGLWERRWLGRGLRGKEIVGEGYSRGSR